MPFWIGLACGMIIGFIAGAAAIAAAMGLWRIALDEMRAHSAELVDRLGEPTEAKPRRRTL
jgi:hypothetical protein